MIHLNFQALQVKPLLNKLITQTIVLYDDSTKDLQEGDTLHIFFENELFRNYMVKLTNVKRTGLKNLRNEDISRNGFLYKPHFLQFCKDKGINEEDTILLLDFELLEEDL